MPRAGGDVYGGNCGQTRSDLIHFSCPCGTIVTAGVHRSVNATRDPALGARAREGGLSKVTCSACGVVSVAELPLVYHDEEARRLLLVLPPSMRHRELEERAELYLALGRDRGHPVPAYARDFTVVFGADALVAELARPLSKAASVAAPVADDGREQSMARREAEIAARGDDLAARGAELTKLQQAAAARALDLDAREQALAGRALELDTRLSAVSAREQGAAAAEEGTDASPIPLTGPFVKLEDEDLADADEGTPAPLRPTGVPGDSTHVGNAGRDLAIERWIGSRKPTLLTCERGHVRLAATIGPDKLEALLAGQPTVRLHLHRLPTYPLLAVSITPAGADPEGDAALVAFLDIVRNDDKSVLGALAHAFELELELYDSEYLPVARLELSAPLDENVRYALHVAEDHLSQLPAGQRSFDAAQTAYRAPGYDRTGRRAQSLDQDSFAQLPSAATTLVAVTVVGFWNEPENQDYLIGARAFPLPWWRALRSRVVARAAELGLAMPPALAQVAVSEGQARSRKDLASKLARAFAEELGRGSDLDAGQAQDNWRALVAECEALGVALEGNAADLAAQSVGALPGTPSAVPSPERTDRASSVPSMSPSNGAGAAGSGPVPRASTAPLSETAKNMEVAVARRRIASPVIAGEIGASGGPPRRDMRTLPTVELVGLLEDKDVRRDAAIELCRRAEQSSVGPVFGALRRMNRGEAVRVLPQVVAFGERAVPHLIDGLRSRKGFVRHGCALALGVVKSGDGIEPLCDLLLAEPTDVWREVARAVGELGAGAIMSLAARLRDAPAERRERISWALAHVAARGGRGPVEALASGRDAAVAGAARRALELAEQAKSNDAEVRATSSGDQTVNRAFSRRFFEALRGAGNAAGPAGESDVVLSADDAELIEDDEEMLDEEDLLPG